MDVNIQQMIFQFIGGLGIFLFGIKYMGDGLQKSAGDQLRDLLDRFTSNPFMGVLTGIVVTILIQSSSGTTVLTVGLVNAGFMTLRQAIGVIMGANIGTTVTAFIIGFDVEAYALPIMFVGTLLLFFFKKERINYIGQVIFGFGALFLGLSLMGDGLKPLRGLQAFHDLTVSMSEMPLLGVFIGTLFTVVVQSSSATIGILQELFSQDLIDLNAALPVLFGDNIGTTITAVLAAIGASIAARRAALTHVIFNLIGTTIFLIFLWAYGPFIGWLQEAWQLNDKSTIAFAHGIFNTTNTLMHLPFIGVLAYLVTKFIPGDDKIIDYKPKHLDPIFLEQSPTLALSQAKLEILRMGDISKQQINEAMSYLNTKQKVHSDTAYQLEDAINTLDKKITDYLVRLASTSLSNVESTEHAHLVDSVRDIERIGDHVENIVELVEYQLANKVKLTESAMKDLNDMFTMTKEAIDKGFKAFDTNDSQLASEVIKLEESIDHMERSLRKKHILRLNKGECSGSAGIVFVDIISNLERIGDHAMNVAQAVIGKE
ncbi:Na/Pi cotransporter family protein [Litoribacterium kuwaitense]|uniref:Na/Pi cotransporter family protein n=1 Tax=Litoribacterium kuwaitense TaxID=1398745 RepID=UPI0028A5E6C2|nr:Na/Pi cotransporter family protein [Litoribacterium kuwaitense]